ncbi:hypothetical protein IFR05_010100 [Cadophora sp. M221]|nr:hypothetical protein IFR05_010100 [Cadophora sp. M221]
MEVTSTANHHVDSFTLFPHLPKELQLYIWELALFPRAISNSSRPPLLFQICHDSRTIALKSNYIKLFSNLGPSFCYFRPGYDTILQLRDVHHRTIIGKISITSADERMQLAKRSKITSFAMDGVQLYHETPDNLSDFKSGQTRSTRRGGGLFGILAMFPSLQEVIFFNITIYTFVESYVGSFRGPRRSHSFSSIHPTVVLRTEPEKVQDFILRLEGDLKRAAMHGSWGQRNPGYSQWWLNPKITLMTEAEFKKRFI